MSQFLYFTAPKTWEIQGYTPELVVDRRLIQSLSKHIGIETSGWFTLTGHLGERFESHFERHFQVESGRDHMGCEIEGLLYQLVSVSEKIALVYGEPDDELAMFDRLENFFTAMRADYQRTPVELHLALNPKP